ncbi:ImmA/IrrE family metallo-endopeptidase [Amycolatopsis sp. H20-H5]|uniref:ImmA/IrrE family metallo-endopeptidase n=1 Tax=Amycolatopsis sp. H20-H5 TaxID=3046309 RepID=UPI002DB79CE0|nr:hypothetical protein [Amycolatopsis sp. H20-H5]MEC3979632.1 hypothetical protein [Amycolatopsis sp. H20-H5]
MTTTIDTVTPLSSLSVLTHLRALAAEPSGSATDDWITTADKQAAYLNQLLADSSEAISAALSRLIPNLAVTQVDNLPVPGTSFWARCQWHIHIRANDPTDIQAVTVFHHLKHIIDHPLRREENASIGGDHWEAIADYFASCVTELHDVARRYEEAAHD